MVADGLECPELPFAASGGTTTTSGAYTIHTFTSSGTFTPNGIGTVEYLIVAGGGQVVVLVVVAGGLLTN